MCVIKYLNQFGECKKTFERSFLDPHSLWHLNFPLFEHSFILTFLYLNIPPVAMFSLGEFMALVIVTSLLFSSFIYPSLLATFGDLAWEYRYVTSYMLVVAMLWHDSVPINITYAWITLGTRSDDGFFLMLVVSFLHMANTIRTI